MKKAHTPISHRYTVLNNLSPVWTDILTVGRCTIRQIFFKIYDADGGADDFIGLVSQAGIDLMAVGDVNNWLLAVPSGGNFRFRIERIS